MENTPKRIGLAYIPDWSRDNPYQKLLYSEVDKSGTPCQGLQGSDFTFYWLSENVKKVKFLHLHWLFGIYDPDRKGLDYKLATLFLLKLLFARLLGYKIFWTVHNFISHEPTNLKLELLVRKTVARVANKVIAHCNHAKGLIIENWGIKAAKVVVIPHGTYAGYYPDTRSRKDARVRIGVKDDEYVFLFFGMLRGYKGISTLIQSFQEVNAANPQSRLVIAGKPFTDTIRQEIEQMAADASISLYLKFIADDEVQDFFKACDVVVLPYQKVLTSGAAILALSFKVPFIVPAKGCMPELAASGFGISYEQDCQLATAMSEAIKHHDTLFNKASEKSYEELSWPNVVNDYYMKILINNKRYN